MKRIFLNASIFICCLVLPQLAHASALTDMLKQAGNQAYYGGAEGTPPEPAVIIGTVIQQVILLVGVIMFAIFIYAGMTWMTASGSPEKVEKAKNLLQNAIWGMLIIGSAYILANFVTKIILQAALDKV